MPVILPTSKAGDGARTGYDLPVIRAMKEATAAQIAASGGAGKLEHFYEAVEAGATILLAASVFHFHVIDIPELKDYLRGRGVDFQCVRCGLALDRGILGGAPADRRGALGRLEPWPESSSGGGRWRDHRILGRQHPLH